MTPDLPLVSDRDYHAGAIMKASLINRVRKVRRLGVAVAFFAGMSATYVEASGSWTFTSQQDWDSGSGTNIDCLTLSASGAIQVRRNFGDEFNYAGGGNFDPLPSFWATYAGNGYPERLAHAGLLTLTSNTSHSEWWFGTDTAPKVYQPVEGDFEVETSISTGQAAHDFGAAQLFVEKDSSNWFASGLVYSSSGGFRGMSRQTVSGASLDLAPATLGSSSLKAKITRVGNQLNGFIRVSTTYWIPAGGLTVNWGPVKVGLYMKDTTVDYAWDTFDYIRFSTTRTASSKALYFSRSIDLGAAPSAAGTVSWSQVVPPGGSLELCTRSSADGVTWGAWSSPYATPAGSVITSALNRYLQFSATLVEDSSLNSPRLDDVTITFPGIAPSAPVVSSSSYPDSTWANGAVANLQWQEPAGNPAPVWAYYYAYDLPVVSVSGTALIAGSVLVSGTVTKASKADFSEGRHTFHLVAQGEPTQYPLSGEALWHVLKDTVAPGAVTITSPTHPTILANGSDSPIFELSAVDSPSSTDEISGMAGYYTVLDTLPTTLTTTVSGFTSATTVGYTGLSDGAYWFHARAMDVAGNLGPVAHYAIQVSYKDRVHVTISSPTDPEGAESASNNAEFFLTLSNPDSATIVGYHYVLDNHATTYPLLGDRFTTGTHLSFAGLANESWWLHVSAKNETGTLCNPTHYGFKVNFQSPVLDEQHVHAVPHPIRGDVASIHYELAAPVQQVLAEFLDINGRKVDSVTGTSSPGMNTLSWDVRSRANGVYFLKLKVRGQDGKETVIIKKLAVVR